MPETDLDLLRDVAEKAGEIALSFFDSSPKIWEKDDNAGPVTEADLAVNAYFEERLKSARPEYGWLSEETEDATARLNTKRQFILDPIDGTRAFIRGSENWALSLAVVEDGQPIAAVVAMPKKATTYWADLGGGAFQDGARIQSSNERNVAASTVLSANFNLEPSYWKGGQLPPFETHFRSSLAYRLSLVAKGRFDSMITLRPTWEWDIAAGSLIVSEAGGCVCDRKGRTPRFNNAHPKIDGVLAGAPIVDQLLENLA